MIDDLIDLFLIVIVLTGAILVVVGTSVLTVYFWPLIGVIWWEDVLIRVSVLSGALSLLLMSLGV